jgi:hypothetical protein
MANFEKHEYKFPDEVDADETKNVAVQHEESEEFQITVEDDTPPEDRGHKPMPKEIVQQIEEDELEEYSAKAKERILQMKKVYHDERREKERAMREQEEAIRLAQQVIEENKKLKSTMATGEKEYISTMQYAADIDLEMAKKQFKEAYESGDPDLMAEAQQKLTRASLKAEQAKDFKPTLQDVENDVQLPTYSEPTRKPAPDPKFVDWNERNSSWFQKDPEMTQAALGLHEKLANQYGPEYVGTDDYYRRIDSTIRKRFPEAFPNDAADEEDYSADSKPQRKATTVVASARRSTAPKQVRLTTAQTALIKKLRITPEQYVKEFLKLEKQ